MSRFQLESRIASLRGRVRRLLLAHGLSWVLAGLLPLVVAACLADWAFHLDPLVRLSLLAAIAAVTGWLGWTRVVRPLIVRFEDLDIALRIEERWPGLNDRLASTIQFLRTPEGDEDRYGSSALRAATIERAMKEVESIDFREVIDRRPILRAGAAAAAALAAAALAGYAQPESTRIAVRRLLLPFGGDRWPQLTHLALVEKGTTLKIARGDVFSLAVAVKPGDRIPDVVKATYRFADGETVVEPLRALEGGEFRGRIETVNQPFEFSVAGGDDSTSIRDVAVRVVPPPALGQVTLRLVSPPYTGVPPQTLAAGLTSFRALEGTRVEISAAANKPLASAELRLGDGSDVRPTTLDPGRTQVRASLDVAGDLSFWFKLADSEGFENREAVKFDVRMFKDEAPRVVIDEPKADRDVPADARIPVKIEVDDDFGIHSARLIYKLAAGDSEPHEAVAVPLWSAPSGSVNGTSTEPGPGSAGVAVASPASLVKHQEIDHDWELAPLNLPTGAIVTFYADARDFDAIPGPNLGKSREIRLRIVSKEDAARQFDESRRELREEIARTLAMQKQAITPVDEARRTLANTNRLPKAQRADLDNAGLIQRQVGGRLSNRDDGLEQKIRRSLDDLRNFKIDDEAARDQMQQMLARLEQVRNRNVGPAEQSLTRAGKDLERAEGDSDQSKPNSQAAGRDQADRTKPNEKAGDPSGKPGPDDARPDGDATSKPAEGNAADAKSAPTSKSAPNEPNSDKGKGDAAASKSAPNEPNSSKADGAEATSKSAPNEPNSGRGQDEEAASKSAPNEPNSGKETGGGSDPIKSAQESLARAKTNQQAIADELQKMLDGLSEFETYQGVAKDAQDVLKKQEEALKQTAEAAARPELAGKPAEGLSQDQKAELGNLASRQNQIAKSLQDLLERMDEMAKRLDANDPLAAAALRDAAAEARAKGTNAKMGEAADRLEKNQMGQARAGQEAARQELKDLVDAVQNRRERELARLVKELKKAEAELRDLRARQAKNLKATREAKKNPNDVERKAQLKKLAKEQEQIQQELKRQLQKLAKLNADAASRAGQQAAGKMGKAQQGMEQDDGDEAGKQEEEALADLNDAQDELEQARKEAEEKLATEQLARMGDQLKSLAGRQDKLVVDAEGYEKLRRDAGDLTRAQRVGVRSLGQIESGLKDETGELVKRLEGAPVFALTLKRASERMEASASGLAAIKTDAETLEAARDAARRFRQLLDAMKPDDGKGGQGGGQGGGGGGGGAGDQGDGIPATAQVKMLKALQEEINDRTEALDELRRRHKELTDDQKQEAERLSADQGTLADLVRDMTRPRRDDGED